MLERVASFTGHRKAGDEGKKLFKAQLVIFVGVQIFHDAFHSFGVLLVLKKKKKKKHKQVQGSVLKSKSNKL